MPVVLAALVVGCASTNRTVYNTLASVQVTTTGAYNGYLDLVVAGKLGTNSVPAVSRDYNQFQMVWNAAVAVAQWNTNTIAPAAVNDASLRVLTDITNVKAGVK